jgi:plastocyanin
MAYAPARLLVGRLPFTTRIAGAAIALLMALATSAIVVSTAGAATPAASPTVSKVVIKGYKFIPNKFTVTAGTSIVVKNKDGATHDLAAVNGAFKTKYIEGGKSGRFTVKKPGTYKIVCTLHTYMTGTLKAT